MVDVSESFHLILSTRGINLFFLSKNLFYLHVGIPLRPMNFRDIIISISQKRNYFDIISTRQKSVPQKPGKFGKEKVKITLSNFLITRAVSR